MNINELKRKLEDLNVNPNSYSLDGSLNNNSRILYHSYNEWHVFYYERGIRENERTFDSEEEACDYIYQGFLNTIEIEKKYSLNSTVLLHEA